MARLRARLAVLAVLIAGPAGGATLTVGPGQLFDKPSAAAAAAGPQDTVLIEPGAYFDCVVSSTPGLVIAGHGPGVVLTDRTCEGKAILVLKGDGAVVRDLTLARARVADNNGAGIRLEGAGLTVERVRFENDQVGLLSGRGGRIVITDCVFTAGGVGGERPSYAVEVGTADALEVSGSRFALAHGGVLRSGAAHTLFRANTVETGAEGIGLQLSGPAVLDGNTLTAGPAARAGLVRAEGDGPVVLRGNRLLNQAGGPATLLLDWTRSTPQLERNTLAAGDRESSTDGSWRHRASSTAHAAKDGLRGLAGSVKRGLLGP